MRHSPGVRLQLTCFFSNRIFLAYLDYCMSAQFRRKDFLKNWLLCFETFFTMSLLVQEILFRIFYAFVAIFIDKNYFFSRLIFIAFIFVSQVVRSSASPLCLFMFLSPLIRIAETLKMIVFGYYRSAFYLDNRCCAFGNNLDVIFWYLFYAGNVSLASSNERGSYWTSSLLPFD